MKRKLPVSLLLLMSSVLMCCSDNPATSDTLSDEVTPTGVIVDLSEPFVIAFDHAVLIEEENLLIIFRGVTESRCPVGVQCFWEGQAIAEFLLIKPPVGQDIAEPIVQPGVDPDSDRFQRLADDALGYRLFLLELNPCPNIDHPIDPHDYAAKLRVEKLPGY
jgi:hypothetical protein